MIRQKTFWFVFGLMLVLSIAIPVRYVIRFFGEYRYILPSADTLYIGNSGGNWWDYIALIFPFLVVLPYSLSFLNENKSGVVLYVQARGNRKTYYYSQLITCFIGTALVFLVPFLLNILLNAILFPVNGNDYISTYNAYDSNWTDTIMGKGFYRATLFHGYLFKKIAIMHPQLYNVLYAFGIAIASGVMGMFTYAVSILLQKNTISLLIANYLFFSIFIVLDRVLEEGNIFPVYINTNLTDYLSNGHFNHGLVYPIYLLFLLFEVVCSVLIIKSRLKKDEV